MQKKTKTEYAVQMRHKCSTEWTECNCFGLLIENAEDAKKAAEYRNRMGLTGQYKYRAVKREVSEWEEIR